MSTRSIRQIEKEIVVFETARADQREMSARVIFNRDGEPVRYQDSFVGILELAGKDLRHTPASATLKGIDRLLILAAQEGYRPC